MRQAGGPQRSACWGLDRLAGGQGFQGNGGHEVDEGRGIDKQSKMSHRLEQVFIHHSVHSPGFCEHFVGAWGASFSPEDKVQGANVVICESH